MSKSSVSSAFPPIFTNSSLCSPSPRHGIRSIEITIINHAIHISQRRFVRSVWFVCRLPNGNYRNTGAAKRTAVTGEIPGAISPRITTIGFKGITFNLCIVCQHTHAGKAWARRECSNNNKNENKRKKTIIIILIKKCNNIMLMYKTYGRMAMVM